MRVLTGYVFCLLALGTTLWGTVYAIWDLSSGTWTWKSLCIFFGSYFLILTGVTGGYHRYLTHHAFEFTAVGRWIARPFLLWAGCLSWQSTPIWWAAVHRQHHQDADGEGDPHSPVPRRSGWWWRIWQFLWAHMLWVPHARPDIARFAALRKVDWLEWFFHYGYPAVGPLFGLAFTFWLWGLGGMAWYLAAVFVVWHLTGLINSLTHLGDVVGYGQSLAKDHSTNIWWLALLTFGEAFHRHHHARQSSPRLADAWWERPFDIGYLEILFLRGCGLVRKLHIPKPAQLEARLAAVP
ncbi:MAG: acyl-CoA desaturase [bacterium]|nr:acyl-CoA desaturase [bacterium]